MGTYWIDHIHDSDLLETSTKTKCLVSDINLQSARNADPLTPTHQPAEEQIKQMLQRLYGPVTLQFALRM